MLLSLFSCFDPSTLSSVYTWKWLLTLLSFVGMFVFIQTYPLLLGGGLTMVVRYYLLTLSPFKWVNEGASVLFSVFCLIVGAGLIGLVPFCFTLSSHLACTLSLSLPLWVGGIIHSYGSKGFIEVVSHFLPLGSPVVLWPFLVLVESVSVLIRPVTLGVRLIANVMAGHLILSLIGMGFSKLFFSPLLVMGFLSFEFCVCVVQAYVFVTLLSLYWDE